MRKLAACTATALLAVAVLSSLASVATASTPRCCNIPMPTTTTGKWEIRGSGDWILWNENTTLRALNLRTGATFTVTTGADSSFDVNGNTVAYLWRAVVGDPLRIYLYDLAARQAYAQPVALPEGVDPAAYTNWPTISAKLVMFQAANNAYAATYSPTTHSIGVPFQVNDTGSVMGPDVSGTNVVWEQSSEGDGVHAGFVDLGPPPLATGVFVSWAAPVQDSVWPRVGGDLVVWDTSEGGRVSIYGSVLDPVSGEAGDKFVISDSSSMRGTYPDVTPGLVVFRATINGTEGNWVYGKTVDTSSSTPTVGPAFKIGGDYESSSISDVNVDGDLVTWDQSTNNGGGTIREPKAVVVAPPRPVAKAPSRATARRGSVAKLRYRVNDRVWKARVTITIKNSHGKKVLKLSKGWQRANRVNTVKFKCRLAKGTYHFYVKATSLTGLTVAKQASNRLIVR